MDGISSLLIIFSVQAVSVCEFGVVLVIKVSLFCTAFMKALYTFYGGVCMLTEFCQ